MGFPRDTAIMEYDSWYAMDIAGLEQFDPSVNDEKKTPTLSRSYDKVSSTINTAVGIGEPGRTPCYTSIIGRCFHQIKEKHGVLFEQQPVSKSVQELVISTGIPMNHPP